MPPKIGILAVDSLAAPPVGGSGGHGKKCGGYGGGKDGGSGGHDGGTGDKNGGNGGS